MTGRKNDHNQVFYVSSHGAVGDHWFDWFARSLNAHPDIMIYMGVTPVHKDNSRGDQGQNHTDTKWLADF